MDNLPTKSQKNLTDIQRRREQLRAELAQIEQDLEGNIDEIKSGIQQKADPRHWIKKHPLLSVGIAVGLGLFIGSAGRVKVNSNGGNRSTNGLTAELKRIAISRGVNAAVSGLEHYLTQRMISNQEDSNS